MTAPTLNAKPAPAWLVARVTIDRYIADFRVGMRTADDDSLAQEAQRLEGLPTSSAIRRMRAVVEGELASRRDETERAATVTAELTEAA